MRPRFSTLLDHEVEDRIRDALESADRYLLLLRVNASTAKAAEFRATFGVLQDLVDGDLEDLAREICRRRGVSFDRAYGRIRNTVVLPYGRNTVVSVSHPRGDGRRGGRP